MRTETIRFIGYRELENLTKEKYPAIKTYEYVAVEECGNDTTQVFDVTGDLDEYDQGRWDTIIKIGRVLPWCNHIVLNKLCDDGYLPASKYVVEVCW